MNRSLSSRPNAQAVVDLYGYNDRVQLVAALNEEQRRHRTRAAVRALVGRLHRNQPERTAATTCATA